MPVRHLTPSVWSVSQILDKSTFSTTLYVKNLKKYPSNVILQKYLERLLDLQQTQQRIKSNKSCRDIPTHKISNSTTSRMIDYQNNRQLQLQFTSTRYLLFLLEFTTVSSSAANQTPQLCVRSLSLAKGLLEFSQHQAGYLPRELIVQIPALIHHYTGSERPGVSSKSITAL